MKHPEQNRHIDQNRDRAQRKRNAKQLRPAQKIGMRKAAGNSRKQNKQPGKKIMQLLEHGVFEQPYGRRAKYNQIVQKMVNHHEKDGYPAQNIQHGDALARCNGAPERLHYFMHGLQSALHTLQYRPRP